MNLCFRVSQGWAGMECGMPAHGMGREWHAYHSLTALYYVGHGCVGSLDIISEMNLFVRTGAPVMGMDVV